MTNRFQTQRCGDWTVVAEREPPTARRRFTSLRPEEPPRRRPFWPFAVAALLLAAAAGTGFAFHRAHQVRLAGQARARQTVTACLARMENLLRQAPSHQNRLATRTADLGAVLAATEPDNGFKFRVEDAISAIKSAERAILDTDTGEAQAADALARLSGQTDYHALCQRVSQATENCRALRRDTERRCQTLRKLTMAADRHIAKLEWDAKRSRQN